MTDKKNIANMGSSAKLVEELCFAFFPMLLFRFKTNSEKRKLHQQHKHDDSANCVAGDAYCITTFDNLPDLDGLL